jgi:molecular chaperone DnaJ
VDLRLRFEEAAEGCKKNIAVTRCEPCACNRGFVPGTEADCPECQGTGAVVHRRNVGFAPASCPRCKRGKVGRKCKACAGTGQQNHTSELELSVPAGVDDGQVLRLAGKGEAIRGGSAGHLYVVLTVEPHPRFTRRGSDLVVDFELSAELASRGGRITVPMLIGERDIDVPAGSRSGDEIVVRGCGVQIVGAPPTPMPGRATSPYRECDTSGRGSLIVRIQVEQRGIGAWMRRLSRL